MNVLIQRQQPENNTNNKEKITVKCNKINKSYEKIGNPINHQSVHRVHRYGWRLLWVFFWKLPANILLGRRFESTYAPKKLYFRYTGFGIIIQLFDSVLTVYKILIIASLFCAQGYNNNGCFRA